MNELHTTTAARFALTPDPSPRGRGELQRSIFKLCLLLLLGAIINVAAAWGMWIIDKPQSYAGLPDRPRAYESGWPLTSLQEGYGHFGVEMLDTHLRHFPYRIIWPGFVADTLVFAVMLGMFLAASSELRRRWRMKHALCRACAYPIGSSAVCTECGQRVRIQSS